MSHVCLPSFYSFANFVIPHIYCMPNFFCRCIMTHFVSELGEDCRQMVGAFLVSVQWNCYKSLDSLDRPLNWLLYNRYLLKHLKAIIQKCGRPAFLALDTLHISQKGSNEANNYSTTLNFLFFSIHMLEATRIFLPNLKLH